jgi:hypothetical protein
VAAAAASAAAADAADATAAAAAWLALCWTVVSEIMMIVFHRYKYYGDTTSMMKHGLDIDISEMRLALMAWMHLNKVTNCVLVHACRRPCAGQILPVYSTGSGTPDVAERSGALRRRAKPCVARTSNNLVWFTATATGAENIE